MIQHGKEKPTMSCEIMNVHTHENCHLLLSPVDFPYFEFGFPAEGLALRRSCSLLLCLFSQGRMSFTWFLSCWKWIWIPRKLFQTGYLKVKEIWAVHDLCISGTTPSVENWVAVNLDNWWQPSNVVCWPIGGLSEPQAVRQISAIGYLWVTSKTPSRPRGAQLVFFRMNYPYQYLA